MNDEFETNKNFLVVGCGGLGCFIIEDLLRLNVKKIIVCDPDIFSESNLNRQLYSSPENIGEKKVFVAEARAKELNFAGEFIAYDKAFDASMLDGVDVVIDALDNIKTRLEVEDLCAKKNIPFVHGAVEGSLYQVGVSMPGSNLLHNIYMNAQDPKVKHTNVLTVQTCAAAEVSLALREPREFFEVNEI